MDKIFLVDKPTGWTSFDVVAKIRGALSGGVGHKVKVGHAGTLDPFATGLLLVLSGKETKNQAEFTKLDKEYEATLKLGLTSTTGDPEGDIIKGSNDKPTTEMINKVIKGLLGESLQTPPAYSAIKINGKRAYALARKGKAPKLEPRSIKISEIRIVEYRYPILKISVACSSGTYIRTLGEDIGKLLGVGAYLTELRRTKIGQYSICDSKTVTDIIDEIEKGEL